MAIEKDIEQGVGVLSMRVVIQNKGNCPSRLLFDYVPWYNLFVLVALSFFLYFYNAFVFVLD